jgi:dihydrofolate reductase
MTKPRVRLPSATLIAARSFPDRIIGVDNRLPWHLRTDLLHFKRRTGGHAIIMGRKTFQSIGRPLPNRLNIVLSRTEIKEIPGLVWANSPETALLIADIYTISNVLKEFFVIGGEKIYDLFEPYINRAWLTDVFTGPINGDAKLASDFTSSEWWTPYEREFPASDDDQYPFRISFFSRRKERHRELSRDDFMGRMPQLAQLVDGWERMIVARPIVPPLCELQIPMFE